MKDRDLLIWIHERLEHVHKENPLIDYMHKLRAVISSIDPTIETLVFGGCNSLEKLKEKLKEEVSVD